eukprot:TRINITY_DN1707_c0_g1_i1.p1 TRINITY_DN1707_c0_g1~~TRINITY_DN1707_c0_g1_i1.p1  ORF type:complete len:709 (-),score=191.94 TRINITY_DN1707_c0_g1_i1:76-2202(-)
MMGTESSPGPVKVYQIGDYVLEKTLGQGQFGKVKLGTHVPTQRKVAVKIMNKSRVTGDTMNMVKREIGIMKQMSHPYIIQLYQVIETKDQLFLVMEHASGGEVMDLILTHGCLREDQARKLFRQAAEAVAFCHSQKTVHRDLKAENLLLDANMNIKLIDFGLSNWFVPGKKLSTFCGSPTYASPELVQRHPYFGPEVDCWALGVLLYVFVCGVLPFDGNSFYELYNNIIEAKYNLPATVSPQCKDLIQKILVPNIANRYKIEQILTHPWVTAGKEEDPLEMLLLTHTPRVTEKSHLDGIVLTELERRGHKRRDVIKSVTSNCYDERHAAYTFFVLKRKQEQILQERREQEERLSMPVAPVSAHAGQPQRKGAAPATAPPSQLVKPEPLRTPARIADAKPSTETPPRSHSPPNRSRSLSRASKEDSIELAEEEKIAAHARPSMELTERERTAHIEAIRIRQQHQAKKAPPPKEAVKSQPKKARSPEMDDTDEWVVVDANSQGNMSEEQRAEYDAAAIKFERKKRYTSFFSNIFSFGSKKDEPEEPRTVRFSFSIDTTSTLPPQEIVAEIFRVLSQAGIQHVRKSPFVIKCWNPKCQIEIEVCKVPHLSLNGLRFHRLHGDSWEYHAMCKQLLGQMHLQQPGSGGNDTDLLTMSALADSSLLLTTPLDADRATASAAATSCGARNSPAVSASPRAATRAPASNATRQSSS